MQIVAAHTVSQLSKCFYRSKFDRKNMYSCGGEWAYFTASAITNSSSNIGQIGTPPPRQAQPKPKPFRPLKSPYLRYFTLFSSSASAFRVVSTDATLQVA